MTLSNEMSYFTMAHLLFTGDFNPINEFASELVRQNKTSWLRLRKCPVDTYAESA
ncbi:hypothetical protein ACPUYX_13535 [Desulfosporosinus sp. SYSU MS00001]|uniref:hypothetical protein n=1 Tax=Desulfosporosinus sp. SYSU MS00001 TaxID=3416284 RepID=UPI003CF755DC